MNSRDNKLGKQKKYIIKASVVTECDVTSTCIWFSMFPREPSALRFKGKPLKRRALRSLENVGTKYLVTYFHIPKEVSPHFQFSEKLRTWKHCLFWNWIKIKEVKWFPRTVISWVSSTRAGEIRRGGRSIYILCSTCVRPTWRSQAMQSRPQANQPPEQWHGQNETK